MQAPARARLLVVDGDRAAARALAAMLRDDGFRVDIASDGGSAIQRLTHQPMPAAIITAHHLPGVDGVTVAVFARSRNPTVPIVFVTAYPETEGPLRALPPPVVVLGKPIELDVLAEQLRALLPMHTLTPPARN
jgi:CheY-like chemotaxis protein